MTNEPQKTIEVEAETLEEAREQIKSQIPEGLRVLSEQIISDGKPTTVTDFADTIESALSKVQSRIPNNAEVLETKAESAAQKVVKITVDAPDEQSAVSNAKWEANEQNHTGTIQNVRLVAAGRKGFLGVGVKPNQYEVELLDPQPAVVVITYKRKAKILAKVGMMTPKDRCEQTKRDGIYYCQNCGRKEAKTMSQGSREYTFCSFACSEGFGQKLYRLYQRSMSSLKYCKWCGSELDISARKCGECAGVQE